jgi:hypothetical protein
MILDLQRDVHPVYPNCDPQNDHYDMHAVKTLVEDEEEVVSGAVMHGKGRGWVDETPFTP